MTRDHMSWPWPQAEQIPMSGTSVFPPDHGRMPEPVKLSSKDTIVGSANGPIASGGRLPPHTGLEPRDVRDVVKSLSEKSTNPKDAVGVSKAYLSVLPIGVMMEVALGMLEGALKYGRHNYRIAGVRASVYFDATMRHLFDWWEGEDIDADSQLSHITKAIASLTVLRDAMMNDRWTDDRPPPMKNKTWLKAFNAKAKALLDKYPPEARKAAFTHEDMNYERVE